MSYSSPKTPKRFVGKGKLSEKSESPKNSKAKRKRNESLKVHTTAPIRLGGTRSPSRTTVSVTIENNRDSDVDGFSITAYLPQSGWKKLKVPYDIEERAVFLLPHNIIVNLIL